MRTRKRITLLLASAGALGVGLTAFPASSAALPPAMPTCTPKASTGSDSCVKGTINAVDGSLGAAYETIFLGTRVRSVFSPASSESTKVIIRYDDDGKINLATVPDVHRRDAGRGHHPGGLGPVRSGPGGSNAYLSPPGNVSGIASTVGAGIDVCTMLFKGVDNKHVTLYARAPIGNRQLVQQPVDQHRGHDRDPVHGHDHESARGIALWPDAHGPQHPVPNPALDDYATVKRGTSSGRGAPPGIPAEGPGGVRLHRYRSDRHDLAAVRRHDGSLPPVRAPDS